MLSGTVGFAGKSSVGAAVQVLEALSFDEVPAVVFAPCLQGLSTPRDKGKKKFRKTMQGLQTMYVYNGSNSG